MSTAAIDEGVIEIRWCRIHPNVLHVQLRVCASCGFQITTDNERTCWCLASAGTTWKCVGATL